MGSPNWFAYVALLLFPPIALVALRLTRSPSRTSFALLLLAMMFLPMHVEFDLPFLPPLDKERISYLSLLLGLLLFHFRWLSTARPGTGLELLGVPMLLGTWITVMTNRDPLVFGDRVLPGMDSLEAPTRIIDDLITFALPFFLGRALIRNSRHLNAVLSLLAAAGLLYSLLILVEMRLSPQLHRWVYGFHPDLFTLTRRPWGYRPWVFMRNGLALAAFMATTLLAAVSLARARVGIETPLFRLPATACAAYLGVILLLTQSVAAIVWGLVLTLVLVIPRTRWGAIACLCLGLFVAGYPALRVADLVPTERIVAFFDTYTGRGWSLEGRFESEDLMLEKSRERLLFGWGGYARHWIYDPETGLERIAPDGYWMTVFGSRGVVGFATIFGLLLIPILQAARKFSRVRNRRDRVLLLGLMSVVLARALDELPNGFETSYPIFLAGGLASLARGLAAPRRRSIPSGDGRPLQEHRSVAVHVGEV